MLSAVAARKATLISAQSSAPAIPEQAGEGSQAIENRLKRHKRKSTSNNDAPGDNKKLKKYGVDSRRPENGLYPIEASESSEELSRSFDNNQHTEDSEEYDFSHELVDQIQLLERATPVSSDEEGANSDASRMDTQYHVDTSSQLSFVPLPGQNIISFDGKLTNSGYFSSKVGTIVILSDRQKMALNGVYKLSILKGSVNLMGSVLRASPTSHPVFAPKCCPIPVIEAIATNDEVDIPISNLCTSGSIDDHSIILLLEDYKCGIEGIGNVCRIYSDIFSVQSTGPSTLRLSGASLIAEVSPQTQLCMLPDSWEYISSAFDNTSIEAAMDKTPVIYVHGPKRCGKSTLARFLCNRLLNTYQRVAYLECDVGQTEFTPSGLVSLNVLSKPLFGPPFSHPLLPLASHYIGATSPQSCPTSYIESIKSLVQTYNNDIHYSYAENSSFYGEDDKRFDGIVPLIINTMGWTKGLGKKLVEEVEDIVVPTHVVSLRSPTIDTNMKNGESSDSTIRRLEVDAITPTGYPSRYSAADWRALSLVSYFHCVRLDQDLSSPNSFHKWDFTTPLLSQPPFKVSINESLDGIILTSPGAEDVVPDEIEHVLNGALVGLVSCNANPLGTGMSGTLNGIPYVQGTHSPEVYSSNCIGLALIRGISPLDKISMKVQDRDGKHRFLHILTPLTPRTICDSNTRYLVKGELEISIWCMLDHRSFETSLGIDHGPFLQWRRDFATGGERRRVRRNLMRRGQN